MSRSVTVFHHSHSGLETRVSFGWLNSDLTKGLATIVLVAAFAALSLYRLEPPAVSSSEGDFPAHAAAHLQAIAEAPHPVGSAQHAKVRDYIMQQLIAGGLTPELQRATVAVTSPRGEFKVANVENVVARMYGNANSKAVLLVAHYDSVPPSFGANDNGSGVITLLETQRALISGPSLKNDVIFLFTDAEEIGLMGANAFVQEHPWAKDVGLALNFDARGNDGPSIMFETSDQNSSLIKEFAKAAPEPIASSLSHEIYRLLPNDTDLTPFRRAGIAGLNFAYIDGITRYHSSLDNKNEISERSFQHHYSYALSLARHFGNLDLQNNSRGNAIYFDVLRLAVLHYPATWALPITLVAALLLIGLIVAGLKTARLTLAGLGLSVAIFLPCLLFLPGIMGLLALTLRLAEGVTYRSGLFIAGFLAITISILALIDAACRKRISLENLTAGALICWLLLLIPASFFLPGGSYLLAWPLLFALPALAYTLFAKDGAAFSWKSLLLLWLSAIVSVLLLVPAIRLLFAGLGLNSFGIVLPVVVLLLGVLRPHLKLMTLNRGWLLPAAAAVTGVTLIAAGLLTSGFNDRQPRPDNLFYAFNADTGQSIWATPDARRDRWTSLVLPADAQRKPLPEFSPLNAGKPFMQSPAPDAQLSSPQAELLESRADAGSRTMRFRISSSRQALLLSIDLETGAEVESITIGGKPLEGKATAARDRKWTIQYYNLPTDGTELDLRLKTEGQVKLRLVDQTYGLPQLAGKEIEARPSGIMPGRDPYNDSTLVGKSFAF